MPSPLQVTIIIFFVDLLANLHEITFLKCNYYMLASSLAKLLSNLMMPEYTIDHYIYTNRVYEVVGDFNIGWCVVNQRLADGSIIVDRKIRPTSGIKYNYRRLSYEALLRFEKEQKLREQVEAEELRKVAGSIAFAFGAFTFLAGIPFGFSSAFAPIAGSLIREGGKSLMYKGSEIIHK